VQLTGITLGLGTKTDITIHLMGPAESSEKVVSNELLLKGKLVHTEAVPLGKQHCGQGKLEGFPREPGKQHGVG
jgi:hypothetical protein